MAENNTDTSQPDIDFAKFLTLLPSALPDHLHYLIRDELDVIHKIFRDLPPHWRGVFIDILSGKASKFRDYLLLAKSYGCPVNSVLQLFAELRMFHMTAKMEAILGHPLVTLAQNYGNPNNGTGKTGLLYAWLAPSKAASILHLQNVAFGLHDMPRCTRAILAENYGNPNNGTGSTGFQRQRSGPSNGSLVHHDTAGLHGNTAGTDVAISAAGHGTPPYHDNNTVGTDLAISVAGHRSVLKPSHATVLDDITNLMKEIFASLNGNPQLARDYPKWFTTLLGINGGVIITLISKSTSNNPQSLSTEIMESFTALSAVVGFSASLAGLYLITNKPQTLPFSCDSEIATRKVGIVGGIATAFAFIAGVLLLLPNNPFRWITMGLAAALLLIPFLIRFLG
ncbi:uncharacterized protein LOC111306995 [Durio zibethinus]|uniref:Uncharacterized protein LOC111306995 n=1 Tax=Durio zibethinus TaxID=66656 RepID=A0A6P6A7N3_DURZI|nr:uncharacterized protein LOC111306995 [Durio zibethinus]